MSRMTRDILKTSQNYPFSSNENISRVLEKFVSLRDRRELMYEKEWNPSQVLSVPLVKTRGNANAPHFILSPSPLLFPSLPSAQ